MSVSSVQSAEEGCADALITVDEMPDTRLGIKKEWWL